MRYILQVSIYNNDQFFSKKKIANKNTRDALTISIALNFY